jgi:AraC-like DNA-binding protein
MKANGDIPIYKLGDFRHVHRLQSDSVFGYDNLDPAYRITGFELYSSKGLVGSVGPLRSDFYRMSITCEGSLDMQIGLEHYRHQERTVSFTYPGQLFAKTNISPDTSGYYMLFSRDFLQDLVPETRFADEFPFYSITGVPVFQLSTEELNFILEQVGYIDREVRGRQHGKLKAIQMFLYLILLQAKRSYERQGLQSERSVDERSRIASRFLRLVSIHYLERRHVGDYAGLLSVTPNYLNKAVRSATGKTASETIREMLLLEARSQLQYTDKSVAEIGYHIGFSDPAAFNRFFRELTGETPLSYRRRHD